MECRFCRCDPDNVFILPLPYKTGSHWSCIPCGIGNGFYCEKHDKPHTYFLTESTGCISCIEELMQANKGTAGEIYDKIKSAYPQEEISRIEEWAFLVKQVTGDETPICVVRSIAVQAITKKAKFEDVLNAVLEIRSADCITPFPF